MASKFDVENREFFLNKNVEASSLEDIILGINMINRRDDKEESEKVGFKRKPIKLIIDSFGGSCYDGMALVNIIRTSKTPVHTYCYGKAISMGLTIFASGHKRFAHRDATLMQHQLSGGVGGKMTDMIESTEQQVRLQDMLDNVLIENSKIKRAKLLEYRERKFDWFFSGKEGFELGVVDELIDEVL